MILKQEEARNITRRSFNLIEALQGATIAIVPMEPNTSIGYTSEGTSTIEIMYVLNFKDAHDQTRYPYQGTYNNKIYKFNKDGELENDGVHILAILDEKIEVKTGTTVVTRGGSSDDEVKPNITSLLPREEIASYIIEALLQKVDDPLSLDDAKINYLTSVAFKIAYSMISTAATYRIIDTPSEDGNGGNKETVEESSSTTEGHLKDIATELKELIIKTKTGTAIEIQYADNTETKLKNTAFSIGDNGLGRDATHPIHITGIGGGSSLEIRKPGSGSGNTPKILTLDSSMSYTYADATGVMTLSITQATEEKKGLMSASDKSLLDATAQDISAFMTDVLPGMQDSDDLHSNSINDLASRVKVIEEKINTLHTSAGLTVGTDKYIE